MVLSAHFTASVALLRSNSFQIAVWCSGHVTKLIMWLLDISFAQPRMVQTSYYSTTLFCKCVRLLCYSLSNLATFIETSNTALLLLLLLLLLFFCIPPPPFPTPTPSQPPFFQLSFFKHIFPVFLQHWMVSTDWALYHLCDSARSKSTSITSINIGPVYCNLIRSIITWLLRETFVQTYQIYVL